MSTSHTSSGGITLNFNGTDLDSVQRPTLVVYGRMASPPVHTQLCSCRLWLMVLWWCFYLPQETVCRPESSTLLVCTAPALSGPMGSINYTIIMDNAPGPSDIVGLRLSLVPNPSIATDGLATTDHMVGTRTPIIINVRTLYSLILICEFITISVCNSHTVSIPPIWIGWRQAICCEYA